MKTLSYSETRAKFSAVLNKVEKGKEVVFSRGNVRFRIEKVSEPQPIPIYPVGYFDKSFDEERLKFHNELMKHASFKPIR